MVTITLIMTTIPKTRFILASQNNLSDVSFIARKIQDGRMNEVIDPEENNTISTIIVQKTIYMINTLSFT